MKTPATLFEDNEFFSQVFNACNSAILVVDKHAAIQYCNSYVADVFGYASEELIGKSILTLMLSEYGMEHENVFSRYLADPTSRTMGVGQSFPAVNKLGKRIDIHIGLNSIEYKSSQFVVATVTKAIELKTIFEQVETESDILHSRIENNKRLIQLANASQDSVIVTDSTQSIVWVNKPLTRMMNRSLNELIGKRVDELFDEPSEQISELIEAYRAGTSFNKKISTKVDGKKRYFNTTLHPVVTENENSGSILYINDLTAGVELEMELKEKNATLEAITQIAKIGHYSLNVQTNELFWSDEVYRIYELPTNAQIDVDKAISFYTAESRPVIEKAIEKSIETGQAYDLELPFNTATGREIWVRAVGYIEYDFDAQPLRLRGAFQDITHLRQSVMEAERGIRAKAAFLANMSHELRTPINGILGISEIISETPLEDRQKEYVSGISKSAKSLLSLVNQVLVYSKMEAQKETIHNSQIFINKLLEQVVFAHKLKAKTKSVELDLIVDQNLPIYIESDGDKIEQILNNLLSNAVKFTSHGRVELFVSLNEKNELQLKVSDTGIGIHPEDKHKLFEAFRQIDMTYTREYEGSGLGLAITKNLVNLLRGHIEVESAPAKGSSFTVCIPVEIIDEDKPLKTQLDLPPFVVLESDLMYQTEWRRAFEKNRMRGEVARDEQELIQLLKKHNYLRTVILPVESLTMPLNTVVPTVKKQLKSNQRLVVTQYVDEIPASSTMSIQQIPRCTQADKQVQEYLNRLQDWHLRVTKNFNEKLNGKRLLIVEDNEINQLIFKEMLSLYEIELHVAENGLEAMNLLNAFEVDLIVMDCQMPVMDGFEATTQIRLSSATWLNKVPIIAATAHVLDDEVEKCYEVGMNDILQKPFTKHQLIDVIAKNL